MDQMECYYEGLVQELEENQKRILAELQNLKSEHSTCGYTLNDLTCVNNELQKRVTVSESALKRARLNYSIAVSQLQKDLDMLSFQVLSMFETNQTVIKEAFSENSPPLSKHLSKGDVLSDDLKKSLTLQENIYKKIEEELGEMCSLNLHLDVYSGTLKETLFEASDHIRKMKEKLQELAQKLQLSNQSRDVLFEDIHNLKGQNVYFLAKCNDLQLQNQMLEADLGNLSNENFLLMEKITECEALLMDYRVYKNKHEVVSAEKLELQNLLQVQISDNLNLQKELETVRLGIRELTLVKEAIEKESDDVKIKFNNGLHEMVTKLGFPYASLEKIQLQLDLVAKRFKNSLESGERHVQNSEVLLTRLASLELELQKISSQDKNFHEQIMGLDIMAEEFEKSKLIISELKHKCEELDRLKESLDVERGLNNKLESTVACLTSELESQRLELESQRSRVVQLLMQHEENLKRLHKERSVDDSLVGQLADMQEVMICEDLKLTFVKTQYETCIEELVKKIQFASEQCGVLERKHLDDKARLSSCLETEARYIKDNENLLKTLESFQIKLHDVEAQLNQCLENEARYVEENRNLASEVESLRLKLEASISQNSEISEANDKHALEVSQLKDMLTNSKSEVEQYKENEMKFHDTESKLRHCLKNEARYIEEKNNLTTELESLRLKLEASIAHNSEISEANNKHALQVSQLKDMLTKSKSEVEQYKEIQTKFHDTESKLSHCVENEARYIEENRNLATELESLKLKLDAVIAHESETSEANNKLALEISQLKDMLTESKLEVKQYKELQTELVDTESRLNLCLENEARLATEVESLRSELQASIAQNAEISDMLTKSKRDAEQYKELEINLHDTELKLNCCLQNEACYIEENEKSAAEFESLRLRLEASIAQNAEISDMLTKSKTEVEQYRELQIKLHDTKSRLNHCLENEAHYIEENRKLASELESLRLKLEASIAQNAEISDMLTKSKTEVEQYKELQIKLHDTESRLSSSLENEAYYIEENRNLASELESLRLKLEDSIAQNAESSDMLTKSKTEVEQYRELQIKFHDTESRLSSFLANEAHYIEENRNLASELDSLRLKLEASIAQNGEISESKSKNVPEVDHGLISREETEILLVVLKGKLDEQNDELIILQNRCNELTNKLSEQILKTEEFKNLSIYLKEFKDNGESAREKKEKEPEGPSESLRMAFIKEQYQTKLQELKQQLSVSKRHNEEMLFKLQDALDGIESMKKSEAFNLKRIQELEAEVDSVNSVKPDYDRIQAELECAVLSLECCKEEKEKVVALLQECEGEKLKIAEELSLNKEQIAQKEENDYTGGNGSITPTNVQATQGVSERAYEEEENSPFNDSKQLTVVNDQFRAQHLRSCMEQLDEELEKMKNDNSLLPLTNYDPSFQDLQRELSQLNQANEELGSIYPNFVDFPGNGNALQRVLALEIELAEALRSKKKSSIQFQSSFLKQHSDEEAVFKSFRDINELIKDMLEIKGKYVNVENELKEMHDRYSQLSLQFAEVEGERQKLMMTLKNVRSSRNLLRLNRSSMAALGDQSL